MITGSTFLNPSWAALLMRTTVLEPSTIIVAAGWFASPSGPSLDPQPAARANTVKRTIVPPKLHARVILVFLLIDHAESGVTDKSVRSERRSHAAALFTPSQVRHRETADHPTAHS